MPPVTVEVDTAMVDRYWDVLKILYGWTGKKWMSFDGHPDWFRAAMMMAVLQGMNLLTVSFVSTLFTSAMANFSRPWAMALTLALMMANGWYVFSSQEQLTRARPAKFQEVAYGYIVISVIIFFLAAAVMAISKT